MTQREFFEFACVADDQGIAVPPHAVGQRGGSAFAAEVENFGPCMFCKFHDQGIVRVEYRGVRGLLVLQDSALGPAVGREVSVAVEVVRRQVENDRDPGLECMRRFELE